MVCIRNKPAVPVESLSADARLIRGVQRMFLGLNIVLIVHSYSAAETSGNRFCQIMVNGNI